MPRCLRFLVLLVFLASPAHAEAPDLTVLAAATPLVTGATVGGLGDLAVRWRVGQWLGLAVNGRAGYLAATDVLPNEALLAILAGPMVQVELGRWQVHAALQLTHVHNTSLSHWHAQPLANVLGDSAGTVAHRTGGELMAGVTWPALADVGRWRLVLETDALASTLPTSPVLGWTAGLRVGVGLQRRQPDESTVQGARHLLASGELSNLWCAFAEVAHVQSPLASFQPAPLGTLASPCAPGCVWRWRCCRYFHGRGRHRCGPR